MSQTRSIFCARYYVSRSPYALAMRIAVASLPVIAGVVGCATSTPTSETHVYESSSVTDPVFPTDGSAFQIDPDGRLRGYVESARASDFCPGPMKWRNDQRCVVTRGWDYSKGVTLVRTYDPSGKLLREMIEPGADLSLVAAEQIRVESLVRSEPTIASVVNRPTVRVWAGGFVFREPGDPFCDRGSRCVHAIAAANDGDDAVAHAIVDLMTDRVVYPEYKPANVADHSKQQEN